MAVSDGFGMGLFGRVEQSNKAINPHAGLTLDTFDNFEAALSAPIDAIIDDERVDIVKIDIHGREYAALKNAEKLFAQRPIFFMEYARDLTMPGSGVPPLELLKLFTQRGYSMTVIGLRGPSVDAGSDIEEVDRIARVEREEVNSVCIDLLLTP